MRKIIILVNFIIVLLSIVSLFGCLISQIEPFEKSANRWVGHSIEERREINRRPGSYSYRIGWKETTYQLDKGNWVYVEPYKKDCLIHWEVSQEGKIVDYTTEGNGCK